MKMTKHMKKPVRKNVKAHKPKGKKHLLKSGNAIASAKYEKNMEVYNRADASMDKMVGNKGIPRKRISAR